MAEKIASCMTKTTKAIEDKQYGVVYILNYLTNILYY